MNATRRLAYGVALTLLVLVVLALQDSRELKETLVASPPLLASGEKISNVKKTNYDKKELSSKLKTPNSTYTLKITENQLDLLFAPDPYPAQKGGSCVGHAIAQTLRYTLWRYSCKDRTQCMKYVSRRMCPYYIWWIGRCTGSGNNRPEGGEGGCHVDEGLTIFNTLVKVANRGWIWENTWKASSWQFIGDMTEPWKYDPPPTEVFAAYQIKKQYMPVPYKVYPLKIDQFIKVLESGHAILFRVDVGDDHLKYSDKVYGAGPNKQVVTTYDDFKMPAPQTVSKGGGIIQPPLSGHAMVIIGYKIVKTAKHVYTMFRVLNSWGPQKSNTYILWKDLIARSYEAYTLAWD